MPTLIRRRAIARVNRLPFEPAHAAADAPGTSATVPLALWLAQREQLLAVAPTPGVALEASDDPALLRDDLGALPLITVRFASIGDGRPFSVARLLRERFGFAGELRAIGHVQRDQLAFMERCGFDAFELRDQDDAHAALMAFYEISESYQRMPSHHPLSHTFEAAQS